MFLIPKHILSYVLTEGYMEYVLIEGYMEYVLGLIMMMFEFWCATNAA
jgi:hypothetical protein